ncbi:MAG: RNA polymerase sigma factor [Solirubrobacteraceae bacterium]
MRHPVDNLLNDWRQELASPLLRARFDLWRESEPALARFTDTAAVIRFLRGPGEPSEKDAVLLALLAWARREPVGGRVVLEAIQPGLFNLIVRLTRDARDPDTMAATIFASMWEGIRRYPLESRRRRVAANLLLDTLKRTLKVMGRESEWQARRVLDRPVLLAADEDGLPDGGNVVAVLVRAVEARAITGEEATVILATRIDGRRLAEVAQSAGLSLNAMRVRRHRAERRLLLFLGYGRVMKRPQKRPLSVARVAGVGPQSPAG